MISEELQVRANEALLSMLDSFGTAQDFVIEQTPLVIQELLAWYAVYSGIIFVIGLLLVVVPTYFYVKFILWGLGKDEDRTISRMYSRDLEAPFVVGGATLIFCAILGLSWMFHHLEWLQIMIAPRLFLLEYARGLL